MTYPPFPGFRDAALKFLRELAQNNRRDWFKPRKDLFDEELEWPLKCLVADVARLAQDRSIPITGNPAHSLFRIYRDVRFSSDKRPYKTHVSAVLSRSGSRNDNGSLYIHVEPGRSSVGLGFWHMESRLLRTWRSKMTEDAAAFLEMRDLLAASDLLIETDASLKRMPRGFERHSDSPIAEYLRWKSFVVSRPLTDRELGNHDLGEKIVSLAERALPLLDYGWSLQKHVMEPRRR